MNFCNLPAKMMRSGLFYNHQCKWVYGLWRWNISGLCGSYLHNCRIVRDLQISRNFRVCYVYSRWDRGPASDRTFSIFSFKKNKIKVFLAIKVFNDIVNRLEYSIEKSSRSFCTYFLYIFNFSCTYFWCLFIIFFHIRNSDEEQFYENLSSKTTTLYTLWTDFFAWNVLKLCQDFMDSWWKPFSVAQEINGEKERDESMNIWLQKCYLAVILHIENNGRRTWACRGNVLDARG